MHKWASVKYEGPSMRRVVQEHFLEMALILTAHALFISLKCSKSVPRNLHQGCLLPRGARGDCLGYQTNPRRGGSQFAQLFSFLVFKFEAIFLAIQKVIADSFLQKMSYLRKIPWQASVEERAETTPNVSVDQEESGSECWNLLWLMRLWDLTTSSNLGSIFWQVCQVVSLIARKQEL